MKKTSILFVILCILLIGGSSSTAKSKKVTSWQEGLEMQVVAFSSSNKTVCVRVRDMQRGSYFSIYKSRNGEKVKDYPFNPENEKSAFKRVRKTQDLDDEGAEGGANPKDGSVITGVRKKDSLVLQVQTGKNLGILQEVPGPNSPLPPVNSRVKNVHWDAKGKVLVVLVTWEFEDNQLQSTDTLHIFRFRPWKVQWL